MSQNRSVSVAVERALAMGAVVAGGVTCSIPAHAQTQPAATGGAEEGPVQEVIITGSRVRRVDAETASPVMVIDKSTIEQTGAATVGDLVARIPSVGGEAVNPALNNGGGFGETNIELRGLDAKRTLILIDGQRVNLIGASGAVDVNQIPLNAIDHVEVLTEGAGAIYGSDAVAGVVNFITRHDYDGLELSGDWGESSKHDAQHHDLGIMFGNHGDNFRVEVGGYYNQQDELNMGQRNWSRLALYLYSGSLFSAGSSRTPTGRITLPANLDATFNCPASSANTVTRIAGTNGTSLADYRCFNNGGPNDDHFNFQPYNLDITPQERGALFTKVNYDLSDWATAYTEVIYNHTHSGSQLAPLPFDANADEIVISKNSIYNPFGTDFGGGASVGGVNPNFELRLLGIGDRASDTTSASFITRTGFKGKIGSSGWSYDASVQYNRLDQDRTVHGYFFANELQAAVGPSFYAGPGNTNPTCGTPAAPIANCTPVNIFDLTDLGPAATQGFTAYYSTNSVFISKAATADFNGPVFKLPAGDALLGVGVDYIGLTGQFMTSSITVAQPPLYLNCQISSEACGGDSFGKYNVKEGYAELYVPLLADLPLVHSLSVDAGVRYSDYSLFGNTTRGSFKVEYRPIKDLLVRGTYAQIFRAPTIADISNAPSSNAPTLNDICKGYTGHNTATYPFLTDACVGVPTTGTFSEPQNQITGVLLSNPNLSPETGYEDTFGFVFDPSFVSGLSVSADYWSYTVNNLITQLDPNYALQQCGTTGDAAFCSLAHRYQSGPNAGQFIYFQQPTFNLGTLKTDGVDIGIHYTLKGTPIGSWQVLADETHLMSWTDIPSPGAAPEQIAGDYSKQFGNYAKDRATLSIGWDNWGAQAMFTARYISAVDIPLTNSNPTPPPAFLGWHLGGVAYFDLTAGYTIRATGTQLRAGILNLADKTPPIAGINSFGAGSSVTDIFTYDTIGRRFYVGFTQKFY
jgi:iron complex outermembrane receptor protein